MHTELNEEKVVELIKDKPKSKLDFLVKRGYIDQYKEYNHFKKVVFLINNNLVLIENYEFSTLSEYINFYVLIADDASDFYDA